MFVHQILNKDAHVFARIGGRVGLSIDGQGGR
jgi:hypothetical protein